jgi:tetratricopeptide (TPR) repeat protein
MNRKSGLYYASECLSRAGRADEALTYVDELKAKHPDAASYIQAAASKAGQALLLEGKFEKAVDALRKAVEVGSRYAGLDLVEALCVLGKFDEARSEAKKLLGNFEGGPEEKHYKALVARAEKAGKPAPPLAVEGWSDDSFDVSSLSGKVYMVYFWSMRKLAMAKKTEKQVAVLQNRYGSEGFQALGLSKPDKIDLVEGKSKPEMTTEDELKMLETWVFNFKTTWPLGLCKGETNHEAYGFWAIPSFGLVDKQGRLRVMHIGGDPDDYTILAKEIEKLLDE